MKRFVLSVRTDNAAFVEDGCDGACEVARILRRLADKLDHDEMPFNENVNLRDYNGNVCGWAQWERVIEDDREDD